MAMDPNNDRGTPSSSTREAARTAAEAAEAAPPSSNPSSSHSASASGHNHFHSAVSSQGQGRSRAMPPLPPPLVQQQGNTTIGGGEGEGEQSSTSNLPTSSSEDNDNDDGGVQSDEEAHARRIEREQEPLGRGADHQHRSGGGAAAAAGTRSASASTWRGYGHASSAAADRYEQVKQDYFSRHPDPDAHLRSSSSNARHHQPSTSALPAANWSSGPGRASASAQQQQQQQQQQRSHIPAYTTSNSATNASSGSRQHQRYSSMSGVASAAAAAANASSDEDPARSGGSGGDARRVGLDRGSGNSGSTNSRRPAAGQSSSSPSRRHHHRRGEHSGSSAASASDQDRPSNNSNPGGGMLSPALSTGTTLSSGVSLGATMGGSERIFPIRSVVAPATSGPPPRQPSTSISSSAAGSSGGGGGGLGSSSSSVASASGGYANVAGGSATGPSPAAVSNLPSSNSTAVGGPSASSTSTSTFSYPANLSLSAQGQALRSSKTAAPSSSAGRTARSGSTVLAGASRVRAIPGASTSDEVSQINSADANTVTGSPESEEPLSDSSEATAARRYTNTAGSSQHGSGQAYAHLRGLSPLASPEGDGPADGSIGLAAQLSPVVPGAEGLQSRDLSLDMEALNVSTRPGASPGGESEHMELGTEYSRRSPIPEDTSDFSFPPANSGQQPSAASRRRDANAAGMRMSMPPIRRFDSEATSGVGSDPATTGPSIPNTTTSYPTTTISRYSDDSDPTLQRLSSGRAGLSTAPSTVQSLDSLPRPSGSSGSHTSSTRRPVKRPGLPRHTHSGESGTTSSSLSHEIEEGEAADDEGGDDAGTRRSEGNPRHVRGKKHNHSSPTHRMRTGDHATGRQNAEGRIAVDEDDIVVRARRARNHDEAEEGPSEQAGTLGSLDHTEEDGMYMTLRFEHQETADGHAILTGRKGQLLKCEDEPIHIPGAIQDYGVLIAVEQDENDRLVVMQVSENSGNRLGLSPKLLFSLNCLTEILDEDNADSLQEAIENLDEENAASSEDGSNASASGNAKQKTASTKTTGVSAASSLSPLNNFQLSGQGAPGTGMDGPDSRLEWACWCALHRPDPKNRPKLIIIEFELETDVFNPIARDRTQEEIDEDRAKEQAHSLFGGDESGDSGIQAASGLPPSQAQEAGAAISQGQQQPPLSSPSDLSISESQTFSKDYPSSQPPQQQQQEPIFPGMGRADGEVPDASDPRSSLPGTLGGGGDSSTNPGGAVHTAVPSGSSSSDKRPSASAGDRKASTSTKKQQASPEGLGSSATQDEINSSTKSRVKPIRLLRRLRKAKGSGGSGDVMRLFAALGQINDELNRAEDLQTSLEIAVGVVAEITGFHRVMIYQFDEQWNGQVVAELVDYKQTRDLYRGLHFPASDIPSQARELYKINKVRLLYDRDQPTARLVCRSLEELSKPLDLTHSYLRAMSPIHIKYLANMGVRASMSISIIAFGQLWGLISCHTYGRYGQRVSFPGRQLCRILGDGISRNIERLSLSQRLQSRKLINTIPTNSNPGGYIIAKAEDLLALFDAEFGVLSIGDEAKILGALDNSQEVLAVLEYLRVKAFDHIQVTTNVAADYPDLDYPSGFQTVAGMLTVPLARNGQDFIAFFRRGQLEHVHWAGNPYDKVMRETRSSQTVLEPRKSFKIWSETVVGRSTAWTDENIETASVLRLVYGKFIEVWRQREAAITSSRLTTLLLSNASHEVRTPLNHIINYLEMALEGPLDDETRESLIRSHSASRALVHVINDLLDLTRTETGQQFFLQDPLDLGNTIEEAVAIHRLEAERRGVGFEIVENPSGTPQTLLGDRAKIRQIVANVTANAVTHTAEGKVTIEWGELPKEPGDIGEASQDTIKIGIAVSDTGAGIPEDQLEEMFRTFEQVDLETERQTPQTSTGHLGLGLAVVARIVSQLGGQLRVESKVGFGSKFTFVLYFRLPGPDATTADATATSSTPIRHHSTSQGRPSGGSPRPDHGSHFQQQQRRGSRELGMSPQQLQLGDSPRRHSSMPQPGGAPQSENSVHQHQQDLVRSQSASSGNGGLLIGSSGGGGGGGGSGGSAGFVVGGSASSGTGGSRKSNSISIHSKHSEIDSLVEAISSNPGAGAGMLGGGPSSAVGSQNSGGSGAGGVASAASAKLTIAEQTRRPGQIQIQDSGTPLRSVKMDEREVEVGHFTSGGGGGAGLGPRSGNGNGNVSKGSSGGNARPALGRHRTAYEGYPNPGYGAGPHMPRASTRQQNPQSPSSHRQPRRASTSAEHPPTLSPSTIQSVSDPMTTTTRRPQKPGVTTTAAVGAGMGGPGASAMSPSNSGASTSAAAAAQQPVSLRVMIVEDDAINRAILHKKLTRDLAHEVVQTVHGEEAVRLYQRDRDFDMILMDLQMPICDGYTATRRIREIESKASTAGEDSSNNNDDDDDTQQGVKQRHSATEDQVPIFAVSASLHEHQKNQLLECGFSGFVLKPLDFARLDLLMRGATDASVRDANIYVPGRWEKGGWLGRSTTTTTANAQAPLVSPTQDMRRGSLG